MTILKRALKNGTTIVFIVVALMISACSFRLMYDYLDWILPWYLDDYVTLTDEQEKLFTHATKQLLHWHRFEELPRYAKFLTSLQDALDAPMTEEQVLFFFDEAEDLWYTLLARSIPDFLVLARQLDDHQVEQIDKALKADLAKLKKKYGEREEEEQRQRWQKRLSERLDSWLGQLRIEQQGLIRHWSESRIDTTEDWLSHRNRWRKKFVQLLKIREQESFAEKITLFLLEPQSSYSTAYLQARNKNRLSFAGLLADMSSSLSDKQRTYLQKELSEVILDLKDLSGNKG